jgi:large subunit ribosomal protein L29
MRMQLATQQLNKVDQIRKVRRDVARVRTVLAEKSKSSAKQLKRSHYE